MNQTGRKSILVTAFEPFDREKLNPTENVLRCLPDTAEGLVIHKLLLPVEFRRSLELAIAAADELSPDAVIMLGQAGGRRAVTPESTARNEMNARIPDNAGYRPEHVPVVKGGPRELYSTLPLEAILRVLNDRDIPCEISDDAGTYVCNALFYGMLNHLDGKIPAGFIHVPYIREQGHQDKPFLESDVILQAVEIILHSLVRIAAPAEKAHPEPELPDLFQRIYRKAGKQRGRKAGGFIVPWAVPVRMNW